MRKTRKPVGAYFIRGIWLDVGERNGDYCALVMLVTEPGVAVPVACYVDPMRRVARHLATAQVRRLYKMIRTVCWMVDELA